MNGWAIYLIERLERRQLAFDKLMKEANERTNIEAASVERKSPERRGQS